MDGRRPARAGAQNPAYRPTRPPPMALTCAFAMSLSGGGTLGAQPRQPERVIQRVTSPPAGLGNKVAVQVHGGGDRLVELRAACAASFALAARVAARHRGLRPRFGSHWLAAATRPGD